MDDFIFESDRLLGVQNFEPLREMTSMWAVCAILLPTIACVPSRIVGHGPTYGNKIRPPIKKTHGALPPATSPGDAGG